MAFDTRETSRQRSEAKPNGGAPPPPQITAIDWSAMHEEPPPRRRFNGHEEGEGGGFDPNAYLTEEEREQKRKYITLTSARTRLVGLQSDAQEMVLAKLRADLVPLSVIEHLITHLFSAVRSGIMAIPERVSQEVAACTEEEEIRAVLRRAVHEVLNELSGPDTLQSIRSTMDDARGALGGSQGLVGSLSAARPNYSKRVGRPPSTSKRG